MKLLALVATIPSRKQSCQRLLNELAGQSRPPEGVILCLDGYGEEAPAPSCPLPIVGTYRTNAPSGPGARWRVAADFDPDDILINLDDDIMIAQAPNLIKALVAAMEQGQCAAAAMGRTADGKPAPPGAYGRGRLIYAAACGLALRAAHLGGLQQFAESVLAAGGPNALGPLGDDDALLSAHLWKKGIGIMHAPTGNIFAAPGTQRTSQTIARAAKREPLNAQKKLIQKITGWPWPVA